MDLLIYFSIPLIGALIGYVTNWVAIWMLFRPHHEKRIFGLRLPFTPGLIPARRTEMAERIGAAIAKHLINEESVARRFDSPAIHQRIEQSVSGYLEQLLTRQFGSINSLVPDSFSGEWQALLSALRERIRSELVSIVHGQALEEFVGLQVQKKLEDWLAKPVGELAPAEFIDDLPGRMESWLSRLIGDADFEERVAILVDERFDHFLQSERPLSEYVPVVLKEALYQKIRDLIPVMLAKFGALLEDDELQKRIKIALYELTDRLLTETFNQESFWDRVKFGLMETFVMSTDEMKVKIDRSVEEAGPRFATLIQSAEVQQKIFQALTEAIESFLARPVSQFSLPSDAVAKLKDRVTGAVVMMARSETLKTQITKFIAEKIERLKQEPLQVVFPDLQVERLAPVLSAYLLKFMRDESIINQLVNFVDGQMTAMLDRPLGRLERFFSKDSIQKASDWLTQQVIEILRKETPKMVQALDVQALVREKVDELPIAEVEQLVLAITSRQLKAITWFGALLGFLIGLLQIALTLISQG